MFPRKNGNPQLACDLKTRDLWQQIVGLLPARAQRSHRVAGVVDDEKKPESNCVVDTRLLLFSSTTLARVYAQAGLEDFK